jgi:parallel beta-helix repeat protein
MNRDAKSGLGWIFVSLAVLALALSAEAASTYYVATTGSDVTVNGSLEHPFQTIQHAVAQCVPGDTVYIKEGEYRECIYFSQANSGSQGNLITIEKDPSANARPVIKGSILATGHWDKVTGYDHVYKTPWTETHGYNPSQVFADDVSLQMIGIHWLDTNINVNVVTIGSGVKDMYEGTFFFGGSGLSGILYVWLPGGGDPNNSRIEVSKYSSIILRQGGGQGYYYSYVKFKGLSFRHCEGSTWGAVQLGSYCVMEECDAQWCGYAGVDVGPTCTVVNCEFSHNGAFGIVGGGNSATTTGFVVENCIVESNNYRRWNIWYWGAGGIKFIPNAAGIVRDCTIANNYGHGLWFDNCRTDAGSIIERNYLHDNEVGIFIEISKNVVIRNNVLVDNGTAVEWGQDYVGTNADDTVGAPDGACGINISSSDNVKVLNNTIIRQRDYVGLEVSDAGPDGRIVPEPNTGYASLTNIVLRNNILYDTKCWNYIHIRPETHTVKQLVENISSDYNCFHFNPNQGWAPRYALTNNDDTTNLSKWAQKGFDQHSYEGDPRFLVNIEDINILRIDSPLVDHGISLSEVATDYRGTLRPQGSGYDMGAYEYALIDADHDGMDDDWEIANGLNDSLLDPDHDGVSNLEEYRRGTNPNVWDAGANIYLNSVTGNNTYWGYSSVVKGINTESNGPKKTFGGVGGAISIAHYGDLMMVASGRYFENVDLTTIGANIEVQSGSTADMTQAQ